VAQVPDLFKACLFLQESHLQLSILAPLHFAQFILHVPLPYSQDTQAELLLLKM